MSALIEKLKKEKVKFVIFSRYNELFYNNPKVFFSFKLKKNFYSKFILKILRFFEGENIINFQSKRQNSNQKYFFYSFKNFYPHLSQAHLEHTKYFNKNNNKKIKCEIFFTNDEIDFYRNKFNFKKEYAIIQTETKTSFTNIKNWKVEKFQEVVDYFDNFEWVQASKNERLLKNSIDLSSNTNLRELAFLIKESKFVLCLEGLYNHIASCFDKRAFVIASGFIPNEVFNYKNTTIIKSKIKPICDPCFLLSDCPVDRKPCTNKISSEEVINTIKSSII